MFLRRAAEPFPSGAVAADQQGQAESFHFRPLRDFSYDDSLSACPDRLQLSDVRLYAYVLMDNHFHLLLRTPRANLWRFMQRLAVELAVRLADLRGWAVGEHYGIGGGGVGAIHRRITQRPESLAVVEKPTRRLTRRQ